MEESSLSIARHVTCMICSCFPVHPALVMFCLSMVCNIGLMGSLESKIWVNSLIGTPGTLTLIPSVQTPGWEAASWAWRKCSMLRSLLDTALKGHASFRTSYADRRCFNFDQLQQGARTLTSMASVNCNLKHRCVDLRRCWTTSKVGKSRAISNSLTGSSVHLKHLNLRNRRQSSLFPLLSDLKRGRKVAKSHSFSKRRTLTVRIFVAVSCHCPRLWLQFLLFSTHSSLV